jgi:hypothetical protein
MLSLKTDVDVPTVRNMQKIEKKLFGTLKAFYQKEQAPYPDPES